MADRPSSDMVSRTVSREVAADTQNIRTPALMRRGLMHGSVPAPGLPSGPAWTTVRELARQRHLRLVQALQVPRNLCSPLPDLMLRRLVAPGRV